MNGISKPGDFPIGSVESRVAMRLQLSNERGARSCMVVVSHIPRPWRGEGQEPADWNKVPRLGEQKRWGNGLMRILFVPNNLTEKWIMANRAPFPLPRVGEPTGKYPWRCHCLNCGKMLATYSHKASGEHPCPECSAITFMDEVPLLYRMHSTPGTPASISQHRARP